MEVKIRCLYTIVHLNNSKQQYMRCVKVYRSNYNDLIALDLSSLSSWNGKSDCWWCWTALAKWSLIIIPLVSPLIPRQHAHTPTYTNAIAPSPPVLTLHPSPSTHPATVPSSVCTHPAPILKHGCWEDSPCHLCHVIVHHDAELFQVRVRPAHHAVAFDLKGLTGALVAIIYIF